jgi:chaperonin GroEL
MIADKPEDKNSSGGGGMPPMGGMGGMGVMGGMGM